MAKRFATIVPHIENLELRKDTGQIPYHFYKELGYESTLVSYFYTLKGGRKAGPVKFPPTIREAIIKDYPFLDSEVKGLKMHFLPYDGRERFYEKAIKKYIEIEAKNIDVLNLFHLGSENIFYALLYKFKNPRGKVYLKLDIDIGHYEQQKCFFNISGRLGFLKKFFYNTIILPLFFKLVHLITAESEAGLNYFKKRFPAASGKLVLIPNGIDNNHINNLITKLKSFEEKENILLTVGRIGNKQKNTEFLLEALRRTDLKEWKVIIAGPIEKEFESEKELFYEKNPGFKNKVIFTGNITNPAELASLYNRSKIFCMPSRWEGFPLAAVEAAYFGNVLLLSNSIYAFNTLSDFGKGGESFSIEAPEHLALLIEKYINEPGLLNEKHLHIKEYAAKKFVWPEIVKKLNKQLA